MSTLHLIPVPVTETDLPTVLPSRTVLAAHGLRHFVVENARSARRALKAMGHPTALQELDIRELPASKDHSALTDPVLQVALAPLIAGVDMGVLSESGCPGIADPGADLAAWAQSHGHRVIPHVGPSSLLLALMGSGLEGQRFSFHGYLPVEPEAREAALHALEMRSLREQATQLFIETPYRNEAMCATLLACLHAETRLTIACDLTGPMESLLTRTVAGWRQQPPELPRLPTVFLLLAHATLPAPKHRNSRPAGKPRLSAPAAGRRRRA